MDRGAHFHRCDLQVHSPRDHGWKGPDHITDDERKAYAESLIQACRDTGLDAIAVTDHHDMAFVSHVRQAASHETDKSGKSIGAAERIVVFPGIELTLGVPCQALLIFDADLPEDMFALALTALAVIPSPDSESKTAEVKRLDHIQSLPQLKAELDKHTYLRNRYIIFPNVSDGGSATLIRKGQQGKYIEMPCVGGYVDGGLEKLGEGNRRIIEGKDKAWGHKRIACFQTSDNRQHDHAYLGQRSTWIKWATATAEALRQACLAQESRISQEIPNLPAVRVAGISVSNSQFLGPIDLELNPQYNALIGGRGTGKSTILEYLRWALCDQPPGIDEDEAPNYQVRRGRLIDQTLKPLKATVQVAFVVNGVPHIVRRAGEDGSVQIKIADGDLRQCSEEEVRGLLPIQAYSQKQLSDVSVRLDELSRFITTPIRSQLSQFETRLSETGRLIRQTYTDRQQRRSIERRIGERELEAASLQEQAETLRGSLTGLSEADKGLLDQGSAFEAADEAVETWLAQIRSLSNNLTEIVQNARVNQSQAEPPPEEPSEAKPVLGAAYQQYQELLTAAQSVLSELVERAGHILTASNDADVKTPWGNWTKRVSDFRVAYDAAVQRSSAHSQQMEQLRLIERRLSEHRRETNRLREELKGLLNAEKEYLSERGAWHALSRERDELIDRQCQELTENSGGAIKAHVRRFGDASDIVNRLRDGLSGSGLRREKLERIAQAIFDSEEPEQELESLLAELEMLADHDVDRDGTERLPDTAQLSSAGLNKTDLQKIARSLVPDDWLAISLTPIRSVPEFEYRSREGDYIPFRNASAGQQATALLKTLLNQVGPPLIIDQPEEDLDNPVMIEVVEQVWEAKKKRQLIFASHNANLVVNGDAELVAWCDYRKTGDQSRGTIAGEGAIDVEDVREAIERIMEGGKEAFNLRKEKYGF